jgi:hypothetical protein
VRPKYQVFVSSTFRDLRDEREAVSWAILKLDHIPVGMENFSASDGRGWDTIARTIDDSDYYVLIVGGRYGSVDPDLGISWTEREYDYAQARGVPVLPFIRDQSGITLDKADKGAGAKKLKTFLKKVESKHLRETWTTLENLCAKVTAALPKTIKYDEERRPRPGWYRGTASGRRPVRETSMTYYHVHLRAAGTADACRNGRCLLAYHGSGLVESPQGPARFVDRIKGALPITSCIMSPPATILNPDQFARNPTEIHYAVEAPDSSPEVHITGEVTATTSLTSERGGVGLHIPHPAERVVFVVDMSAVEVLPASPVGARLVIRNEKGVATRRRDLVEIHALEDRRVWMVSAKNVPADANIEVSWGDD